MALFEIDGLPMKSMVIARLQSISRCFVFWFSAGKLWNRTSEVSNARHIVMCIDVLFPLVGRLIEGLVYPEITTGFYDDRWYSSSRPLYFYQKDIMNHY